MLPLDLWNSFSFRMPLNAFSLLWLRLDNHLLQRFVSFSLVSLAQIADRIYNVYVHICICPFPPDIGQRGLGTWRGVPSLFANWFTIVYGYFRATVSGLFLFLTNLLDAHGTVYRTTDCQCGALLLLRAFPNFDCQNPKAPSVRAIITIIIAEKCSQKCKYFTSIRLLSPGPRHLRSTSLLIAV